MTIAGAAALLVAAGGGCEAWKGEQTTDVNVIIPKLMKDYFGPKPEEAAAELFNTTSPDERRDAIAYLAAQPYGHEPPYIRAYTFLTTDPHPMVRAQAMRALGGAQSPEVVPTLLGKDKNGKPREGGGGLTDKDAQVRADAAQALYYSWSDEAIEPLADRLAKDTNPTVRANAARALARTSDPRAIKALIAALDAKDPLLVYDAYTTLVQITGQQLGPEPRYWKEWYAQQKWAKTAETEPSTGG